MSAEQWKEEELMGSEGSTKTKNYREEENTNEGRIIYGKIGGGVPRGQLRGKSIG